MLRTLFTHLMVQARNKNTSNNEYVIQYSFKMLQKYIRSLLKVLVVCHSQAVECRYKWVYNTDNLGIKNCAPLLNQRLGIV